MSKLTNLSTNQKKFIKGGVIFLLIAVLLASSILCSYHFLFSAASEQQLKYFEEVANTIYSQTPAVLYEVPDNVSVSKDDFSITVSDSKFRVFGSVTASIENGKLAFEYNDGNTERLIFSIIVTSLLAVILLMGGSLIYAIIEDYIDYYLTNRYNIFKKKKKNKSN